MTKLNLKQILKISAGERCKVILGEVYREGDKWCANFNNRNIAHIKIRRLCFGLERDAVKFAYLLNR